MIENQNRNKKDIISKINEIEKTNIFKEDTKAKEAAIKSANEYWDNKK